MGNIVHNSKSPQPQISGIKVTRNFPIFDFRDTGIAKIRMYDTLATYIYNYENQILYQVYYPYTDISRNMNLKRREYRCFYFIYTNGCSKGLFFDSTKNIYHKKVPVDSMLNKLRQYKLEAADLFQELDTTFLKKICKIENRDVEEWYQYKGKKDTTMKGMIIFSFSMDNQLREIRYSFSKELDQSRQMKLFKITTTTNQRYIPAPNNILMDQSVSFYLLENINVQYPQIIYKYFEMEKNIHCR